MPRAAPEARVIKDLRDWQKHAAKKNRNKHQWGWFQHNAGDVEYNTAFFNHVSGADGGDTSVLAGSVGDGGMGEGLVEGNMENEYILYYDDIDVEGDYGPMDWETGRRRKEYHSTTDYELKLDRDDLFNDLYELYQANEAADNMTEEEIEAYVSEHFDELFDKYYENLKEKYRSWAEENANDEYEYDEDAGLDDWYDMLYRSSIDIEEALNCIDKATCNRYDLRNLYECQRWPKESKKHLQEMLKKKVAPSTLYTYLAENSLSSIDEDIDDWRVGQTVFADDGYDYKIVNTLDVKDVDGYELAVVALMPEDIGNPRIDDPDFQYAVMLDDNLEWGLCDTYDEAKEWYDGVNDGYYSDGSEYDDDIDWESHWEGELMDVDDDHFDDGHYNSEDDTFGESLDEDTIKQGKHWVNKGKDGTHGKFATKKEADAQRKAMFANGYKESKEDGLEDAAQEYTSANTSINSTKLPAIFSMVSFKPETINLDYGGGKFDNATTALEGKGVTNLVYDPYNRSAGHNKDVINTIRKNGGADTVTYSNVLNVIKEPEARAVVIKNIYKLLKPNGVAYFTVYEGTGKGDEGPTKSGYQLNRKTGEYIDEIMDVFPSVERHGKLIIAYKGIKEDITEAISEGKVTDLNIEINDDGSYEEWLDKAEYKLHELAQELRYLKHPARRREINAGGDDSMEELQERIAAASKEYDELKKQYDVVLAEYEKHI